MEIRRWTFSKAGSPGLLPEQVSLKPTSSLEQSKANSPALVLLATCSIKN